jgi:hypothetical protein
MQQRTYFALAGPKEDPRSLLPRVNDPSEISPYMRRIPASAFSLAQYRPQKTDVLN